MSYIYSKRWSCARDTLISELKEELLPQPENSINWSSYRNSVAKADEYVPKTWILNCLNWVQVNVWNPYLRPGWLADRAENHVYRLIELEDRNTEYANLGPVNAAMNTIACIIHDGPDAISVRRHLESLRCFLWVNEKGMCCNGTDGVQCWDTSFTIISIISAGLEKSELARKVITRALRFLEQQQFREECESPGECYREARRGTWGFSTRVQGYTVSDCTAVAITAIIRAQSVPGIPQMVSPERLRQAIDVLLKVQNDTGGCSSYEPRRGSTKLECLNSSEVFGRIMVEQDYPECTSSVTLALNLFHEHDPRYRADEIRKFSANAVDYVLKAQRPDGSWYGSWGICFSYAGMFALELLAQVGKTYESSEEVRKACKFFLDRQNQDGGWGETYENCQTGKWCPTEGSFVVQTAWVCIALMYAKAPQVECVKRGIRLIIRRQKETGEWEPEAIEGIFNQSCAIKYPNYKFYFSIKALGMFGRLYENRI